MPRCDRSRRASGRAIARPKRTIAVLAIAMLAIAPPALAGGAVGVACDATDPVPACAAPSPADAAAIVLARLARAADTQGAGLVDDPAAAADRRRLIGILAVLARPAAEPAGAAPAGEPPGAAPPPEDAAPDVGTASALGMMTLPPPPLPPRDRNARAAIAVDDDRRVPPVAGRLVHRFGASAPGGGMRRGVTYRAEQDATVVAPAAGRVAFAGPFRGYGLLLIVEHADGYHSLLTGLGRIDTHIGRRVRAGDRVGAAAIAERGVSRVYLELRQDGRPVDPVPWLTSTKRKVGG